MIGIGIVAEGKGDQAVIENIIGAFPVDVHVRRFVPDDAYDRANATGTQGGWTRVKEFCLTQSEIINQFFSDLDNKAIIIQLDTAECEDDGFDVKRPAKTPDYCSELRSAVMTTINGWLTPTLAETPDAQFLYAIAIEETEAWIIPLFDKKKLHQDTALLPNPKKTLSHLRRKAKQPKGRTEYDVMNELSRPIRKKKKLSECASKNPSLLQFCQSIEIMLNGEDYINTCYSACSSPTSATTGPSAQKPEDSM